MSQHERPAPDLAAAGVKLWKSVRDFSRAVTANLEDSWGQATAARPQPAAADTDFVKVPRALWDDLTRLLDDEKISSLTPMGLVVVLARIRERVETSGH